MKVNPIGLKRRAILRLQRSGSFVLALCLLAPVAFADTVFADSGRGDTDASEAPGREGVAGGVSGDDLTGGTESEIAVDAGESPAEPGGQGVDDLDFWLSKLARAVTELEYSGLVTFEHAGVLETLKVVHAVRSGEQVERVRYLSGQPRELVSHGSGVQCPRRNSPTARAALWDHAGQREMQRSYQFLLGGEERIADRDTLVIEARPRDRHRLGILVNLDRETGLPLRTMLVNRRGKVLERYQFVSLDLSPVEDADLQPQSADARRIDNNSPCTMAQSRWQLRWLPDGFKRVAVKTLSDGDMLVYSDGLSVFSVFVQRLGEDLEFRGGAVRGATVAYMDRLEQDGTHYTVTVVGEIPDSTARLLAQGLANGG